MGSFGDTLQCGGCSGLGTASEKKSKQPLAEPLIVPTEKLPGTLHFREIISKFKLTDEDIKNFSGMRTGVALERQPDGKWAPKDSKGQEELVIGNFILHTRIFNPKDSASGNEIRGTSKFVAFSSLKEAAFAFGEFLVGRDSHNIVYSQNEGLDCPLLHLSITESACVFRGDLPSDKLGPILAEVESLQRMTPKGAKKHFRTKTERAQDGLIS